MFHSIRTVNRDNMQRVQNVGAVLLVDQENNSPADSDEIRMGNIEAATIRHSNSKGLKRRSEPITNMLEV